MNRRKSNDEIWWMVDGGGVCRSDVVAERYQEDRGARSTGPNKNRIQYPIQPNGCRYGI